MGKGEISWNKTNYEGKKFQVYAHRIEEIDRVEKIIRESFPEAEF